MKKERERKKANKKIERDRKNILSFSQLASAIIKDGLLVISSTASFGRATPGVLGFF